MPFSVRHRDQRIDRDGLLHVTSAHFTIYSHPLAWGEAGGIRRDEH
jgi:hypothetical protein